MREANKRFFSFNSGISSSSDTEDFVGGFTASFAFWTSAGTLKVFFDAAEPFPVEPLDAEPFPVEPLVAVARAAEETLAACCSEATAAEPTSEELSISLEDEGDGEWWWKVWKKVTEEIKPKMRFLREKHNNAERKYYYYYNLRLKYDFFLSECH